MTGRENIVVSRVLHYEAAAMAEPIELFCQAAIDGMHPDTAAAMRQSAISKLAVAYREDAIARSGRLSRQDEMGFVVAKDITARHRFAGVVGFGSFVRGGDHEVVMPDLHVLPGYRGLYTGPTYRGFHIGPALLKAALTQFDLQPDDEIITEVAERDEGTRRFMERIGFIGDTHAHDHAYEPGQHGVLYRNYAARHEMLLPAVQALLDM